MTTKYMAKFQTPTAASWPKIMQPECISKLICNLWLCTLMPTNQVNISKHSEKEWWQLNICPNFKVEGSQLIQKSLDRNEM